MVVPLQSIWRRSRVSWISYLWRRLWWWATCVTPSQFSSQQLENLDVSLSNSALDSVLIMSQITSSLFNKEIRRKSISGENLHALVMQKGKSKSKKPQGHGNSMSRSGERKYECYHCGREGHIKRDCRLWKTENLESVDQKKEEKVMMLCLWRRWVAFSAEEGTCLHVGKQDVKWVVDSDFLFLPRWDMNPSFLTQASTEGRTLYGEKEKKLKY